jgi:hypothetical protein
VPDPQPYQRDERGYIEAALAEAGVDPQLPAEPVED